MIADCLMVIDLQNAVVTGNDGLKLLLQKVNGEIAKYRAKGRMIIFVQHNDEDLRRGTRDWDFVDGLDIQAEDTVIEKTHANSFLRTTLQSELEAHRVRSIEVCGAQTEYCVDTTVKMAHGLGYEMTMKYGMTTTNDNYFMNREDTIKFYEQLWKDRFVHFDD